MKDKISRAKLWSAFKNVAIIFSFSLNVLLLTVFVIIAVWILPSVNQLVRPVVSNLSKSVEDMATAHILRTIQVQDQIPIAFELPVSTVTNAQIIQPVPMVVNSSFVLPAGGGTINGTVYFELPQGTELPVALDILVPVSQTVPIEMAVGVDIPLEETEMGPPLSELSRVAARIDSFLSNFPSDNFELFRRLTNSPESVEFSIPAGSISEREQASP